jgi:uncharacterized protein (DUF1330 family)
MNVTSFHNTFVLSEGKVAAYVIVDVEILDAEIYESYKKLVPASIEQYGGRFLVRGGKVETLEGAWSPGRFVMLEFPSPERAKAWYESAEYAPAKALRHKSSQSHLILAEGV